MLRSLMAAAAWMAVSLVACNRSADKPAAPVLPPPEAQSFLAVPDAGRALEQVAAAPAAPVPATDVATVGLGLAHDDARPIDHLARAKDLEQTGDYEGALSECRRAAFDDPGQAQALETLARLAGKTMDKPTVAAAFVALSQARPDDATVFVKLARAQLASGDPKGAVDSASQAIALDAGLAEAHHLRGLARLRQSELTGAIRDFRKATALAPNHGWAFNNLGYALLLAGKPDQAREPLEHAAALLPKVAFVQNNLGLAYEKAGLKDEAKAAYEKALELRPRYVKAKVNSMRANQVAQSDHSLSDAVPAVGEDLKVENVVPMAPAAAKVDAESKEGDVKEAKPDTGEVAAGAAGKVEQGGEGGK